MTQKKHEYTIQDKTFKMKKMTVGASIAFDKVLKEGITEETFPQMMAAMFPEQGAEEVDWMKIDVELWTKIQQDFFLINKSVLDGQINLLNNITSAVESD